MIGTDIFDEFLETNSYSPCPVRPPGHEHSGHFCSIPPGITWRTSECTKWLPPDRSKSSSKLADSHYQPFAGIYAKCCPARPREQTLNLWNRHQGGVARCSTIPPRHTSNSTSNVIDEERMAVLIQDVRQHTRDRYYPPVRVAPSVNFYPVGPEKHDDGVVSLLRSGKANRGRRFCS